MHVTDDSKRQQMRIQLITTSVKIVVLVYQIFRVARTSHENKGREGQGAMPPPSAIDIPTRILVEVLGIRNDRWDVLLLV